VLQEGTSDVTYLAKLRALVKFFMNFDTYDESLVLFYPYTPKGVISCDDKAISHFLLYEMGAKGSDLVDIEVCYVILYDFGRPGEDTGS